MSAIDILNNLGNRNQPVIDYIVAADTNSLTISGLDHNRDGGYDCEFYIKGSATADTLKGYMNGNSNVAYNVSCRTVNGVYSTTSDNAITGFGGNVAWQKTVKMMILLNGGYPELVGKSTGLDASVYRMTDFYHTNNLQTETNITSLTLTCTTAGNIKAGTRIRFWARNR